MTTMTVPAWADPRQITDPADRTHIFRSPIRTATFGPSELRSVIVDDGSGPRLHLEAKTIDGLDVQQAAALLEALAVQVSQLREATAQP
ncbi:hypothetical protein [Georgenia ruanii]|uniref:hypothetical protein n=1 Tax=Georgenia ruanii TaxID=348442 RepID=UPI001265A493|nr:hypothetical protein [Georgenia ruanii]